MPKDKKPSEFEWKKRDVFLFRLMAILVIIYHLNEIGRWLMIEG